MAYSFRSDPWPPALPAASARARVSFEEGLAFSRASFKRGDLGGFGRRGLRRDNGGMAVRLLTTFPTQAETVGFL